MRDDKVSMYQLAIICILVSIVPIVRYFPISLTGAAGRGAWVAAILTAIPAIILVCILHELLNKLKTKEGKPKNLNDVFDAVYGKVLGKMLSFIYLIWILIFVAAELRFFGERLISTTYIYTPITFLLVTMLILTFFVARGRISNFGRFAEIFFELFLIIIAFVVIASASNFEVKNVWPINREEITGIPQAILRGTSIFGTLTVGMFFAEKIEDRHNLKKYGIISSIVIVIIGLIGLFVTLGTFGKDLLPTLAQPFFMALKVISVFGVIERIESVFITFWVVADFILITYDIIIASNICKQRFKLTKRRIAVTPLVFITFILSMLIANNFFALQILFTKFMANINLIFGLAIPIVTYLLAKARGLMKKSNCQTLEKVS